MNKTLPIWLIMVTLFSAHSEMLSCNLSISVPELSVKNRVLHIINSVYLFYCPTTRENNEQQLGTKESDMPITTTVFDELISLSCEVPKPKYRINSTLITQFSVTNVSNAAVYLITPKPEDIYILNKMSDRNDSLLNKDMYIKVKKSQIYSEYFELPQLVKLSPGEKYTDKVQCKLVNYTPGATFSVYLSVFYMNEARMAEINRLVDIYGSNIGLDFRDRESSLTSLPIKLSTAK